MASFVLLARQHNTNTQQRLQRPTIATTIAITSIGMSPLSVVAGGVVVGLSCTQVPQLHKLAPATYALRLHAAFANEFG